jgi:hypothetical protein
LVGIRSWCIGFSSFYLSEESFGAQYGNPAQGVTKFDTVCAAFRQFKKQCGAKQEPLKK